MTYNLSDYTFDFPPGLIAQRTAGKGKTRILLCPKNGGPRTIVHAPQIVDHIHPGDCLVVNDTRVIPARLFGETEHGGKVEVLLVRPLPGDNPQESLWEAWAKPGKAFRPGRVLQVAGVACTLVSKTEGKSLTLRFAASPPDFQKIVDKNGHIPLPPYIARADEPADRSAYQTVFAKHAGAVAAPTASLHFSEEMLAALRAKGVRIAEVTLHVGPGTFANIAKENEADFRKHTMHTERFILDEAAAGAINRTKAEGGRVICVGTTAVRTVESAANAGGTVNATSGETSIFLYPGVPFRVTDGLLTNFHWPQSSLILLVSAFYGRENTLAAYQEAIQNQMKLFSYGDGMLIL